jgi:mannan endo-1,4-beta-mannosidase
MRGLLLFLVLGAAPLWGAVAATNLTAGGNTSCSSPQTTASITPASNALILVFVRNGSATGDGADVVTMPSADGLTFEQVGTRIYGTVVGAGKQYRVTLFRAMAASPATGALSITFPRTQGRCEWIVDQFTGVDTGGTNGSGAIAQFVSNDGNSVQPSTVNIAATGPVYAASGINLAKVQTAGTGYSRLVYTVAGYSSASEWNGTPTSPVTMNWDATTAYWGIVAAELVPAGAAPGSSGWTISGGATFSPSSPSPQALFGVRINDSSTLTTLNAMETWLGKKPSLYMFFESWCDASVSNINTVSAAIWANGQVPVLSWQPADPGPGGGGGASCGSAESGTPSDINIRIKNGNYDAYIDHAIAQIQTYLNADANRKLYIRFAHEMNGWNYVWREFANAGNTSLSYRDMWQHTYSRVMAGISTDRVQWIWNVNDSDNSAACVGFTSPASACKTHYYPGDAYVQWLGVDGYLQSGDPANESYATTFGDAITVLHGINATKPLGIHEFGYACASTPCPTSGTKTKDTKDQWIQDTYSRFLADAAAYNIKMVLYYTPYWSGNTSPYTIFRPNDGQGEVGNVVGGECGTGYTCYSGFKTAVTNSGYLAGGASHITLGQFKGQ